MAIRLEQTISLTVAGDGTATQVTIDLRNPPINLDIGGNRPNAVQIISPSGITGSLNSQGTKLTLIFEVAPPDFDIDGSVVSINAALVFPGE